MSDHPHGKTDNSSASTAIQLLQQRFKGRDDLYLIETESGAQWRRESVTPEVLLAHLQGEKRVGLAATPEQTLYVLADFDGKNRENGNAAALVDANRFAEVVDADAGLGVLLELSRSCAGYHAWLFFDPDEPPSLIEARQFVQLALGCAGLPSDGDESKSHPGIFPHPPGPKGVGRAPFLPWCGLLGESQGGLFVDLTGRAHDDQESVLADVRLIRRTDLLRATETLEVQLAVDCEEAQLPSPEAVTESDAPGAWVLDDPKHDGRSRHDELLRYTLRLRSFHPEAETRQLALALAHRWGLLPSREAEVVAMVTSAYLKPAIDVATQYDREQGKALPPPPAPVDLYSAEVKPEVPQFTVENLIRRSGLHLVWAPPSGGKTWTLLRVVHELLLASQRPRLLGHPDLWIRDPWKRVLWMATEETGGILRHKADQVRAGLGSFGHGAQLDGEVFYVFAGDARRRVTLDDLPHLFEKYGPFDGVVLDSLTGLRPKTVHGERIRWDLDNDAANELCLLLRGLATDHETDIILVHHTGRDTTKGYRGPTDWWASADVMVGLVPDAGRTKVTVDKNRDGKRIAPFILEPSWNGGVYSLEYAGTAAPKNKLTPSALEIANWMQEHRQASQAEIVAAKLASRSATLEGINRLLATGSMHETGNRVNNSPIYRWGGPPRDTENEGVLVSGSEPDTDA